MPSRMLTYGGALLLWLLISTAVGEESIRACLKTIRPPEFELEGLLERTADELSNSGKFEVNASNILEVIRDVR
ncbi:MAG: hypothetical protein QFX35_04115 [Candidatus Verstraetearchaeota archaeon]|nr:hypothetical protein [Candidatus Verstraetearchaeota archaeon]